MITLFTIIIISIIAFIVALGGTLFIFWLIKGRGVKEVEIFKVNTEGFENGKTY